jgi:hypothetical protein
VPALRRHGRAVLSAGLATRGGVLLAAIFLITSAHAQTAFEPHTVAYALCVTSETKRLALMTPELPKDAIIERAFGACDGEEAAARQSLAEKGVSAAAIEERFAQTKKFIRVTAPDDIDRQRINRVPR